MEQQPITKEQLIAWSYDETEKDTFVPPHSLIDSYFIKPIDSVWFIHHIHFNVHIKTVANLGELNYFHKGMTGNWLFNPMRI